MNVYCKGIIFQMDLAVDSVVKLMDTLSDEDLNIKPTAEKWSIGELLAHMSVISKADFLIGLGASEEELDHYYEVTKPESNLNSIAATLIDNYSFLRNSISELQEEELLRETTSFFGAVHSRYEWLLDTQSHFFHHRGQLHAMLVHVLKRNPDVKLFE
ncbi:DinB family protein [Planococcus shenhongbingii]|uniref:DinB family protein n=1 Tax=Planococcus shenhongbingii TaxID=3058398 RepID=A0ABT8NHB7_9BACL|nr:MULTISPECIES: DinB family protein [unclassified Planococcus (in: firmicutes)]MDN7247148.1 DinB family protein [Planococcus sp. N017]WKA57015.1 DinB family protein [Planococcus sp. N016]